MRNNTIAIDLGSVNTGIYQLGSGVVLFEPSVVALGSDEKHRTKAVGGEAKKLIGKTGDSTKIVFPIFEAQIEDEKVASVMVENFLNKITLNRLSLRPRVVLSVPCGLESAEIKKYERVLNDAGVYGIEYVESPILTALGLGVPISESNPCFVIDFGGGTTSMAAVSLDGMIAGVNVNMGGSNIDAMLIDYIEEYFNLKIGTLTAERIKIQIGSLLENDATRTVVSGRDMSTGKPRSVSISAQDIRIPIKMFFDKIFEIAEMVMAKLPAEVSAEIRKTGVYFAGGTSKVVGLADYFHDKMAIKANVSDEPEMATVLGGGLVAGDPDLLKKVRLDR